MFLNKITTFIVILFTIIFSTFSLFIWAQVGNYLYEAVDKELRQYKKQLEDISKYSSENKNFADILAEKENNEILTEEFQKNLDRIANPRVVTILRDSNGQVLATSLKVKSFAEYLDSNKFDKDTVNNIYEISINSKYYYRGMTCKLKSFSDEVYYVDILINVNSEKSMIENFTKILIIGTSIVIILSIFVSFYLAQKAMKPIVKAYKKQTEFVQNASHELRTPLTIIQAKQEMLLQEPESRIIEKSEDIALTLNETRRLSKMVKELMDLARVDNNQNSLNKTKTDLNNLIKEIAVPYEEMAELENKKFIYELKCNVEANVDKNKIKQLLIILLDNAIKYTEEGDTITIEDYNQDEKVFITIKDTGIGIGEEAMKHVFERFYREDKARSREKGGSGLGLSIAHTIVKAHGGNIKITANKPKGTVVIVRL